MQRYKEATTADAPLAFLSPNIISEIIDRGAASVRVTGLAKGIAYSWIQQKIN
jgi:hypothetical protein